MNVTMMLMSSTFATVVETMSIVSLSMTEKAHITVAKNSVVPPSASRSVRLRRLMRWNADVMAMPASVEQNVAISMGTKMSVGLAAPSCAR